MSPSNEELTISITSHIHHILSNTDTDTTDYAPQFDLSKPSAELAATIDHTILKPDATVEQVVKICKEAREFGFKSVCVNSTHIPLVTSHLQGSTSIPCSVIGFPLGASSTASKIFETQDAISDGAQEIDMVIPIGHIKSKNYNLLLQEISSIAETCHSTSPPALLKVIIETVFLTPEEIVAACYISAEAGADYVKTSTGFSGGGATVQDVRLMRRAVEYKGAGKVKVKASAGIRTFEQCVAMLKAGASRIGASAGVAIMKGGEGAGY